jgi:hypothetical protein
MRILSVRVIPVARVLAIVYGVLGFAYVPALLLIDAKQMVFPVGIVGPPVFLSLNLHFALPTHFVTGVLSMIFACLCFALTGFLTGAATGLAFNFVAKRTGGVDASVLVKNSVPTQAAVIL